jgi:CubicO group peptidase (beta-lactamase class C family)
MFKKFFSCLLISVFITCSNVTFVSAAQDASVSAKATVTADTYQSDSIKVNFNGKSISLNSDSAYFDSNSKVMLPLTSIIKELDSSTSIQISNGYATITSNKGTIKVHNGDKSITLNGATIDLSIKSFVNNVEIFVPLQFFSEVLNKIVDFDSASNTVNISDIQKNTEKYFNNSPYLSNDKDISKKVDDYLNAEQKIDNFSGSVLVAKGGTVLLDKGYNMSNFEQNVKNTAYTTFPIGSMTKQFTSMAIMQLVEKGMINEQDKVSKYIPDFPNGDKITIDNLLTHTSGLGDLSVPELLTMKPEDSEKVDNVINLFKNKPLNFNPGTKFQYSNSGYILLGYIVEKVSGIKYADYLQNNIFKPLNMDHTGMGYNGTEKNYTSNGYTGYLDVSPISDEALLNGLYGAGALYSTTEDLYKWDRALKEHKLVNEKTSDKIFSNHVAMSEDSKVYYGYGWMLYDSPVGRDIFHGGNILGFTSNIARFVDKDLTIIILSNIGYSDLDSINNTLTNICLGYKYEMPKSKEVVKIDTNTLNKYTGEYSFSTLGTVSIANEDGHTYFEIQGQPKYEMFPEAQNKFFFRAFNGTLTFNTNDEGQVTSIDLYQLGLKYSGNKTK